MRTMLRTLRCWMVVVLLALSGRVALGESVATMPAPTGYVSDLAGLLTPETKASLEELCSEVDHQVHAQIAVVTVKSLEADPVKNQKSSDALPAPSIEEFTTALEDKWKVGAKGTDRGILLIVSLNPRKYRIEVGYGLEGILNDAKVGDIGREMAPLLHAGDYNQAIPLGTREIAQDIAADAGVTLAGADAPVQNVYREQPAQQQVSPIGALIVGVILMVVIGVLIRTGHIGLLFFLLFNLLGGGGGGGRDDDDRGGGFGGFGGGGSGGGGASGDF